MKADSIQKTHTKHKFPHLQSEVDVILEVFDYASHGTEDDETYNENIESDRLDIEEVMNGKIKKYHPHKRQGVVDMVRAQDVRQAQVREDAYDVSIANMEDISQIEKDLHVADQAILSSDNLTKGEKKRLHKMLSLFWKVLRF